MDVQTTAAEMRSPNGDATAILAAANRYDAGRDSTVRFWNITVHPNTRQGQSYHGARDTFEGAQALAGEALVLADVLVDLDRQATVAAHDLAAKLRTTPAPEVTTAPDDGEPPF